MKTVKHFLLCFCTTMFFVPALAQDEMEAALRESLAAWDVLSNNVTLSGGSTTTIDNRKEYSGSATAFGQTVTVKAIKMPPSKFMQLQLVFPEAAQFNTDHINQVFGSDVRAVIPPEVGSALKIDRLEVDLLGKKVDAIRLVMKAQTWRPFGDDKVTVTSIRSTFAVVDPKSSNREVAITLSGSLNMPQEICDYLKIGSTGLTVRGSVETKSKRLSLAADLTSEKIPIGDKQSVVFFRNAFVEFYVESGKPGVAVGGSVEVNPKDQPPVILNGEMSIDLTGDIYGEAYLTGYWQNPFNISKDLYITNLGMGFGVALKTTPFPMPILAFEGGLQYGSPTPDKAKFGGKVTLALNCGDPTKTMIDANEINANAYELVNAFYPPGVPSNIAKPLKDIQLKNARLMIVPPGGGAEYFGQMYYPGVHIQGKFQVGDFSGEMLIKIDELGVEGYGTISPIRFEGFSMTNAAGNDGPEILIMIKKGVVPLKGSAFILDGKLSLLGASKSARVYLSDAGFDLTLEDKLWDLWNSRIEVAGKDLLTGGNLYVGVNIEQDLMAKIGEVASQEIDKTAQQVNKDMQDAKAGLELNRPKLNAAEKKYNDMKAVVKADWAAKCNELNKLEEQKAAQDAEEKRLTGIITKLDAEIKTIKNKINNGHKPATFIKKTSCADLSQYDPRNGGECWTCPSGFKRDIMVPVFENNACFKEGDMLYKKGTYHGASYGLLKTDCGSGQYYDPINGGTCWSTPSGYTRDNTKAVNDPKAFWKQLPMQKKPANRIAQLACTGDNFIDPRNGGECWTCPNGYDRPPLPIPVTDPKACERVDMIQLQAELKLKEADRLATIADRDVIKKTLGDISNKMTEELHKACEGLANSELVNADPRVAPLFDEFTRYKLAVDGFQEALDIVNGMAQGTLGAAKWVVENGGSAMGIVNITSASFTGCVSTVNNGNVALKVKGTYADNPINCSFDINLKSPDQAIREFADQLLKTNTAKSSRNNGTCTKPQVPRPDIAGSEIEAFKNNTQTNRKVQWGRPKRKERPSWAGKRRFEDGNFVEQLDAALEAGLVSKMVKLSGYGINMNVRDKNQATPLQWAAAKGSLADMTVLVRNGADPKLKGSIVIDPERSVALGNLTSIAAYKGDLDMLIYIVDGLGIPVDDRAYNINTKRSDGGTAITAAAFNGKENCVKYLVESGASPSASPTAVLFAMMNNHTSIAKYLLDQGFPLSAAHTDGFTALHFACKNNELSIATVLVEKGADINAATKEGWTPLILAAYYGRTDICKLLVNKGANRDATYQNKNAARWAKKQGFKDLAKWIKKPQ